MPSHNGKLSLTVLAVIAVMLASFAPMMLDDSDAEGVDLSIYRYTPKLTVTSEDFSAIKYVVWDFGDGTVLDGRWEYYIELQESGATLSDAMIQGINGYRTLKEQNGNSLFVTTHTYAQEGVYTATVAAMNPLGFVPEGGSPYDGVLNQDETGYNGGIGTTLATNITVPTDLELGSDSFKAIAGTWDRVQYVVEIKGYPTITFDTKGGSAIAPMEVQNTHEYTAATAPQAPTKDGCTFNGWYTDNACTQAYDWTQKVTQPITLYAGWTESSVQQYDHIITYKDDGVAIGTQNTRNEVNGPVTTTITEDNPSKEGKVFKGWVANEGDVPVLKGATVSVPVTGLVLNAVWEELAVTYTHTIHYVSNGGMGAMSDLVVTDNVSGNTPMTLGNNLFSKENHRFVGWKVGTEVKQPGQSIDVAGNQTVTATAQWEETATPVTTITVYVDGMATPFEAGSTVADIVKPVQAGYTFAGWFTTSAYTAQVGDSVVLTDGMHLFSKMDRNPEPAADRVTVKVDGKFIKFDKGKTVADVEKPTKKGEKFDGWYSDEALTHEVAETVVLTDGMALYSKMTDDPNASDWTDYLVYIVIAIGIIVAVIGLFVHPVMLIAGIAIAAAGGLDLLDIIDLF